EPGSDKQKKKKAHPPPLIPIHHLPRSRSPTSLPHLLPQTGNAPATPPPQRRWRRHRLTSPPLPEILFDATTPPANLARRRPLQTSRATASYRIQSAELATATTAFFLSPPPWRGTSQTCATVELACPSASSPRMPFFLAGADVGRHITPLAGTPLPCPRAVLAGHTDLLMRATLTFLE
uniref:Uncharacterized protein n=5 Tax=Aegilops tauschii subsp. strangulata TaxID=200361 RepID=A0A453FW95_AEGTS